MNTIPRLNLLPQQYRPFSTTVWPPISRFYANTDKMGPLFNGSHCWLWTGGMFDSGYARITIRRRSKRAHKWYWELINGPVATGLQLDHLCRVRHCVNPNHLEAVTAKVNSERRVATIMCCLRMHPYDAVNTRINSNGARECRQCRSEAKKHKRLTARGAK